jgi:Zn-dependent peptidase ImmA (M78 family)
MVKEIESLPEKVILSIKHFINNNGLKSDAPLRDGIFALLEKYCTVLYYPQENEENDGCHVKRLVNNEIVNFVFINTHKSIEKQVFTAAHELGHILNLSNFLKNTCPDFDQKLDEIAMNKFAALLLLPEDSFSKELQNNLKNYSTEDEKISLDELIKLSLYLMDFFFVPFKSVIIRMFELGYLSQDIAEEIIKDKSTLEKINDYIKNLGYKRLGIRSEKKSIKDFAELLERAEKSEVFSLSKINSIRTKMDLPDIKSESLSTKIQICEPKPE